MVVANILSSLTSKNTYILLPLRIDLVRFLTCASVIVKCNSKLQQLRRLQRLKQQPLLAGDKNAKALALQSFHHFVPVEWPAVVKEVVG